jgi:nitrite reductase (NADH) large subunit
METTKTFPNYLQMRQWLPIPVWHGLRLVSVGVAFGLCMVLFVRPVLGLWLFWQVVIPFLPLLFFIAPGLWRNLCPLAAMNQTPRLFQLSRSLTLPRWVQEYGYVIAITLFLLIVPARKLLFNSNGPATALLILAALATPFVMGNLFKGKSG